MSNEVICRYFLRGTCRFGEYCRFAHTISVNDLRNINNTTNNDNNLNTDDNAESINIDPLTVINSNQDFNEEISTTATTTTTPTSTSRIKTTTKINTKDPNVWVMAPVFVPRKRMRQDIPCSSRQLMDELLRFERQQREAEAADNDMNGASAGPSTSGSGADSSSTNRAGPSTRCESPEIVYVNDVGVTVTSPPAFNEKSYAEVVAGRQDEPEWRGSHAAIILDHKSPEICPYLSYCIYGRHCVYTHYEQCDMCGEFCLHPKDKEQRKKHIDACIKEHEIDMELSFAVQRSKDKVCGICFDVIVEKSGLEQKFGILPNCNHVFCLTCIRKWRQSKQFESKITRSCPECRTPSDYVCPSQYWVDTKEDKDKLLITYKAALGKKDCKYFKKGEGKCPFGNKCFYKHALPNGDLVDVGGPNQNARKVHRSDDEIFDLFDQVFPQIFLWDFVESRDVLSGTASEESDSSVWSDIEVFLD